MSQQEPAYGHMTQPVFDLLRAYPDHYFTVEEISKQQSYTPIQARIALDILTRDGHMEKERSVAGGDQYVYRPH